jgi:hypothetical protein
MSDLGFEDGIGAVRRARHDPVKATQDLSGENGFPGNDENSAG